MGRFGLRADAAPLAERVRDDLIAEQARRLGGLAAAVVAGVRPRFLEHDDVGVKRGNGSEIVEWSAPSVDTAVHVEVGDAEHGPARR